MAAALLLYAVASYVIYHFVGNVRAFYYIPCLIPFAVVQIPRWHDTDRSAWYAIWGLVPGFNLLIALVLGFIPGTNGTNRYGVPR